jgi:hypothetical protein
MPGIVAFRITVIINNITALCQQEHHILRRDIVKFDRNRID